MRATVALVVALLLGACGVAGALDDETASRVDAAERSARQAEAAVDDLRETVDRLAADLDEATGTTDDLERRLERISERLDSAVTDLRAAIAAATSRSRDALDQAGSAVARIDGVARDLAVLTERFDYHLKNHGGGR